MSPHFGRKLNLMVSVLNDLDVVQTLVYMCVGNANNCNSQPVSLWLTACEPQ